MFNAEKVKNECVSFLKDWFEKNGPDCKAVVGISGGKDSTVVAALCVEALGKDRVIGVLMPNHMQSDIEDSKAVVKHLGIKNYIVDIAKGFNGIKETVLENTDLPELSRQATINLAPRMRMATLYAISQTVNGRVINTGNMSEKYIGYFTQYGDGAGDVAPLQNLTKSEVVAVGLALGLPEYLVKKAPTDGLSGKTDEESIGFTYDELDLYIRTGEIESEEAKERIDRMHKNSEFKRNPIVMFFPED